MPEILWKAYIDFEIEQEETDRARDLYKRLLQRTQHVKVWLSFAQFELQVRKKKPRISFVQGVVNNISSDPPLIERHVRFTVFVLKK